MRFFLAGIMQGSHVANLLHNQEYRQRLKALLVKHVPGAKVYDPLADHQDSINYGEERGKRVFMDHNRMCGEVDVVLAFVPEATMGTAIEMWEAHRNGRIVATISPLKHNWAVKFLSHILYSDVTEFEEELTSGEFGRRLGEVISAK